jgi:hypothetical protein
LGLITGVTTKPSHAIINSTLDRDNCMYGVELTGRYSIKVGGVGTVPETPGASSYSGSFEIPGVNGNVVGAYLYWTNKKSNNDDTIQLKINNSAFKPISADQTFGPAVLNGPFTTYWGYIEKLNNADIRINQNNTFTIQNSSDSDVEMLLFGSGILIIHEDPTLTNDQHVEVKCGFDGSYESSLGSQSTVTKWGGWSNVVCHEFPADLNSNRLVKYYAFMSGTKKKTASPVMYRPNAFWYITGKKVSGSIPQNIFDLNEDPGVPNRGLNTLTSIPPYLDLFDATSGNEWDTITSDEINPAIVIPEDHEYICFQTQSRNLPPNTTSNGRGSSMQWSMSALTFAYSGVPADSPTPTPTPTEGPTPTPTNTPLPSNTPTPTPVVYYPWAITEKGNTYVNSIDQTTLGNFNMDSSYFDASKSILTGLAGRQPYISSDLFLQPISSSLPSYNSGRNAGKNTYKDKNSEYKSGVSWYNYFYQYLVNSRTDVSKQILNGNSYSGNTSNLYIVNGIPTDKILVFTHAGDLNLDLTNCDTKSIFLIDGNLNLNPNLSASGNQNGCTFIVSGTTRIQAGDNITNDGNTYYDKVDAYFITHQFITDLDSSSDGLYIYGGVVETVKPLTDTSLELNRNLTSDNNQYSPSEVFAYDPRYLYIYGDLMTYIYGYNIREGQFIRSL